MNIQTNLVGRECSPKNTAEWDRGRITGVWTDSSNVLWVAVETERGKLIQTLAVNITLLPEVR